MPNNYKLLRRVRPAGQYESPASEIMTYLTKGIDASRLMLQRS